MLLLDKTCFNHNTIIYILYKIYYIVYIKCNYYIILGISYIIFYKYHIIIVLEKHEKKLQNIVLMKEE